MNIRLLIVALLLTGCATLRSNSIFALQFSAQPPRVMIRGVCNGETFTTQGVVVCEQKVPKDGSLIVSAELEYGDGGLDVRTLQSQLNANGASLTVDDSFGAKTLQAVKNFQKARGLPQTGVADRDTLAALNIAISNNDSQIFVKIPPLQGRVIFSNGQIKATTDFNWYPKEGFWFWKKTPIKDTWIPLDLGEIASTFGDWPVALDVAAVDSKVGVVVTRGIAYYRVCNDVDVACSKMIVQYMCAGRNKSTQEGLIGKCSRLSGSAQSFTVPLNTENYQVTKGAKIYVAAAREAYVSTYSPTSEDFAKGFMKVEVPNIQSGPSMVNFAMDWIDANDKVQHVETRVLLVGYDPAWTGLDQPHYLNSGEVNFVRPVLSDLMETNVYQGRTLLSKHFSNSEVEISEARPRPGQVACAFAWQRDNSDQTVVCVDSNFNEVPLP